jgi:hypothetical protein
MRCADAERQQFDSCHNLCFSFLSLSPKNRLRDVTKNESNIDMSHKFHINQNGIFSVNAIFIFCQHRFESSMLLCFMSSQHLG